MTAVHEITVATCYECSCKVLFMFVEAVAAKATRKVLGSSNNVGSSSSSLSPSSSEFSVLHALLVKSYQK